MPSTIPLMDVESFYGYIKEHIGVRTQELFDRFGLPSSNPRVRTLKADKRIFWQKNKGGIKWFPIEYAEAHNIPKLVRSKKYLQNLASSKKKRERASRSGATSSSNAGDLEATIDGIRNVFWLDMIMIPTN